MLSALCPHHLGPLSLIFRNMNSQRRFTSQCQNLCLSAQGWLSDCQNGFAYALRVESTYWFISPSVPGAALTKAWWMRGIKAPAPWIHDGLSSAAELQFPHCFPTGSGQCCPQGLWLYCTLLCLPSFPGPSFLPCHCFLGTSANKSHWHTILSQDLLKQAKRILWFLPSYSPSIHNIYFFLACVKSYYYTLSCLFTYLLPTLSALWTNWEQEVNLLFLF